MDAKFPTNYESPEVLALSSLVNEAFNTLDTCRAVGLDSSDENVARLRALETEYLKLREKLFAAIHYE